MGEHIYKVGDWVRSLVNWGSIEAGKVYKIPHLDDDGEPWFTSDGKGGWQNYLSLSEIEPWTPKVGELVRYKNRELGEATVLEVDGENHIKVDTHGPYKICTEILSDLEPLPVAAEAQPAAELQIEAGKFYRTRDGRKVGPMRRERDFWNSDDGANGTPGHFTDSGISAMAGRLPREPGREIHDLIAEWVDEPVAVAAPAVAEASNDNKPKFKVGDRVVFRNYSGGEHCYGTVEDVSVNGKRVLASDWSIGAEVGYLPVADLELADTQPDTSLHIKFTSDFSELDAAILVRKKKLKKLIKLARKAGIELLEAA